MSDFLRITRLAKPFRTGHRCFLANGLEGKILRIYFDEYQYRAEVDTDQGLYSVPVSKLFHCRPRPTAKNTKA